MWTAFFGSDPPEEETEFVGSSPENEQYSTNNDDHDVKARPTTIASSSPPLARRPSQIVSSENDDDDMSPMSMLLKRMNVLMVKVGEHEFEKKTLVSQMEKERVLQQTEVAALKQKEQELKDQIVQLQYKIEYNSEPMLIERLQDMTDMRDALTGVKEQLENALEVKDKMLMDKTSEFEQWKATQTAKQSEMETELRGRIVEMETQLHDSENLLHQQRAHYENELVTMQAACETQMQEHAMEMNNVMHSHQATVEKLKAEVESIRLEKQQEVMDLAAELSQQQTLYEQKVAEKEQIIADQAEQLMRSPQPSTEAESTVDVSSRIVELENQLQEQTQSMNEMKDVMEDYKDDCMELWKSNETLKQQLALASADSMLKEAEFRQHGFNAQSRVSELESQVEDLQESLTRAQQELAMKEEELLSVATVSRAEEQIVEDVGEGVESPKWKENAVRVLTEQVAAAQRELSEAMELNAHMNHRNVWLEEQYQKLTATNADFAETTQVHQHVMQQLVETEKAWNLSQQEVERLQGLVHIAEQRDAMMTKREQAYTIEREKWRSDWEAREGVLASTQQVLEAVKSESEALKEKCKVLEIELQDLQQQQISQKNEPQALFDSPSAVHSIALEQLKAENKALRLELEQLQQLVHDDQSQKDFLLPPSTLGETRQVDELFAGTSSDSPADSELVQARMEIDKLRAQLCSQAASMDSKVDELERLNVSLSNELNTRRASDCNAEMEKENLVAALSTLQETAASLETANSEYAEKIFMLQQQLDDAKREKFAAQAEVQALSALDVESVSSTQVVELENQLAKLRIREEEQYSEVSNLQARLEEAQRTGDLAQNALCEFQAATDAKQTALAAEIESLQHDVELAESTLEEAETSISRLTERNNELETQVSNLQQELQASRQHSLEIQNKLEEAMNDLTTAQKELVLINESGQSYENAYMEAYEKLARLEADVKLEQAAHQNAQKQLETMKVEAETAQNTLHLMQTELEAALANQQELLTLRELVHTLETTVTTTEANLRQFEEEKQTMQTEIDRLVLQHEHERKQVEQLRQQFADQYASVQLELEATKQAAQALTVKLEETVNKEEQTKIQLDKKRAALKQLQDEFAKLQETLQAKDLERETHLNEVIKLQGALDKSKDDKKKLVPELKSLRMQAEQWREEREKASAERMAMLREADESVKEVCRLQGHLKKLEKDKSGLEISLRQLQDEKNRVVDELRSLEGIHAHTSEVSREQELTLAKLQKFCDEVQAKLASAVEERQAERAEAQLMKDSLIRELEKVRESRYQQEPMIESLRLEIADLKAEKNILAARSHRLMQELGQFTTIPDDELEADASIENPDLWELLSTGMEQLKADLEIASKYAASIEQHQSAGIDTNPESVDTT